MVITSATTLAISSPCTFSLKSSKCNYRSNGKYYRKQYAAYGIDGILARAACKLKYYRVKSLQHYRKINKQWILKIYKMCGNGIGKRKYNKIYKYNNASGRNHFFFISCSWVCAIPQRSMASYN